MGDTLNTTMILVYFVWASRSARGAGSIKGGLFSGVRAAGFVYALNPLVDIDFLEEHKVLPCVVEGKTTKTANFIFLGELRKMCIF
jgi:hypothetical protein